MTTALTGDLERRKLVRLRVRADLGITPSKYEGKTHYVVKDPVSLRYYRFNEQEYFVVKHFDGKHTLEDTQKAFEREFRPHRLTLEDLEGFAQQLLQAGLVQHETAQAGKQLYEKRRKQRRNVSRVIRRTIVHQRFQSELRRRQFTDLHLPGRQRDSIGRHCLVR